MPKAAQERYAPIPHDGTESTAGYNHIVRPFANQWHDTFKAALIEGGRIDANDPGADARVGRVISQYAKQYLNSAEAAASRQPTSEEILGASYNGVMDDPKPEVAL